MEILIEQLANLGEQVIHYAWLPLLIWTTFGCLLWIVLRSLNTLHPQIQYHGRLAILLSLPAGFLILLFLHGIESFLLSGGGAENSLKIISVMAPMEITAVQAEKATVFTTTNLFYSGFLLMIVSGIAISFGGFMIQWMKLQKLRSSCSFIQLGKLEQLDKKNHKLLHSTGRTIWVSFQTEEIIPVTFGIKKPVILLSESIQKDPEKLNLVIRHELSHISQNDFLSQLTAFLTSIIFWFHPLVHQLKRELVEYREMRCDSLVLSEKDVSVKKYASLLLELLHLPNINKDLSVNMAQESSNLKKRIQMITQQNRNTPIPKRWSLTIFGAILCSTAVIMACTDMQTHDVFDNEELDLLTDLDQSGDRGYHQILIFMGDEGQADRHEHLLSQLDELQPNHIEKIDVLKGEYAVERFGSRAANGIIVIQTRRDADAFNTALRALGMEEMNIENPPPPPSHPDFGDEDYFVVVEEMPELIGGLASIQRDIRYPETARRAGIEGRVYIQFIINEQGDVENPIILRGIGGGVDEEALRVVSNAKFNPGMQRGQPVRVLYSLPILFRLQSSDIETSANNEVPENGLSVTGYSSSTPTVGVVEPEVIHRELEVIIERSGSTVSGVISDAQSGNPITGANIIIDGTNTGTVSNEDGEFTLTNLDPATSEFTISHVSYGRSQVNF